MNDDQKVGGGCQCGCCGDTGDTAEMTGPGEDRERLIQLGRDVEGSDAEEPAVG